MKPLINRCATCRHWQGDKAKALAAFKENPVSMDLDKGWPNNGECAKSYDWSDFEIVGHAYVEVELNANFGCVYWESD